MSLVKATETVAWECAACGHRHLLTWLQGEARGFSVVLHCKVCTVTVLTRLVRIGVNAWAALYPPTPAYTSEVSSGIARQIQKEVTQ